MFKSRAGGENQAIDPKEVFQPRPGDLSCETTNLKPASGRNKLDRYLQGRMPPTVR